jgi:hypothetical protein
MSSSDDSYRETNEPPPVFHTEYCKVAEVYYRLDGDDAGLAEALGTDIRTLREWKDNHPEFAAACELGKSSMNDCVDRSVFLRAIGYEYTAEQPMSYKGIGFVVPYRKHVPPDVRLAKFWRWKHAARIPPEAAAESVFAKAYKELTARKTEMARRHEFVACNEARPAADGGQDEP